MKLLLGSSLAVLVFAGGASLVLRNKMIATGEEVTRRWANVGATQQRRLDLIPRLVETVREAAAFEGETLQKITEARNQILALVEKFQGSMVSDDRDRMQELENNLAASVRAFTGLAQEAYPELASLQAYRDLMSQLEGTENRINVARQDYNEAVSDHNTLVRQWGWLPRCGSRSTMDPYQSDPAAATAPALSP